MEEWKQDRLIDILDTLIDYRGKTPNKVNCGIPLITAKIVKNGRIDTPTEFLPTEDYAAWMVRGYPKAGDVVLTTEAPLGEVAQLKDENIALAQRIVCLRGKDDILDNTYLKYFLMSNIGQYRLKARETGTTVTGIKQSELKKVLIDYPNYETQQHIANFLSSLDEKIELNRRINDNLEQQAQALFKAWFVDFEPFKDGEFVDSELGMIPKSWLCISFGDFIVPSNSRVSDENTPEYSVTNTGICPRDKKFKKQLGKTSAKNKLLQKDNLVFGMSREILNWGIMEDEIGGVSSAYNVYILNKQLVNPLFLKYFMVEKQNYFNDLIGTAAREGQSLDKGALVRKVIYIPPKEILDDFLVKEKARTAMSSRLACENHNLRMQRDTLLPKLMSGELKINDINC